MAAVTDNGWTLHYTIGSVIAAKVRPGDIVHMPGGQGDLIVLGGQAPKRVNDKGSVQVRSPLAEDSDRFDLPPRALGVIWKSAAGGLSELPA